MAAVIRFMCQRHCTYRRPVMISALLMETPVQNASQIESADARKIIRDVINRVNNCYKESFFLLWFGYVDEFVIQGLVAVCHCRGNDLPMNNAAFFVSRRLHCGMNIVRDEFFHLLLRMLNNCGTGRQVVTSLGKDIILPDNQNIGLGACPAILGRILQKPFWVERLCFFTNNQAAAFVVRKRFMNNLRGGCCHKRCRRQRCGRYVT